MTSTNEYLEELLEKCGGMGRFQWFVIAFIYGSEVLVTWSMLMMTFGGHVPDWWCNWQNTTIMSTSPNNSGMVNGFETCVPPETSFTDTCSSITFSQEMNTIVNEWELICDKDWTRSTITTIQMGGLLLSGFIAGQLADSIGRKPTHFLSLLFIIICNIISAFSVSWQMFATLRFFIGVGCGCFLAVYFPFAIEFTPIKHRAMIRAIPGWPVWASVYGLVCWWLHDWQHVHIATAVVGAPFLLFWFVIPESFRWLVSHNKLDEAELVIKQMSKYNGTPEVDYSQLRQFAKKDCLEEEKSIYSPLDLFKNPVLRKRILLMTFAWLSCGYGFYATSFGVDELSGNLYLNMALISIVEIPAQFITWFCNNCIGRRWTCFLFSMIAASAGIVVGVVQVIDAPHRDILVNAFSLTAKLGVSAAWAAVIIFTSETFPTVVRNIAYGILNSVSRIGAMIAPQLIRLNKTTPGLMYFIFGVVMFVTGLLPLMLPETKDKALQDNITSATKIRGKGEDKSDDVTSEPKLQKITFHNIELYERQNIEQDNVIQ